MKCLYPSPRPLKSVVVSFWRHRGPTKVDSSSVFAIRLTGNIFLNPLWSNRHESFPLVSSHHTGSRFARDLENIASRVYAGWVENVVESTRIVSPCVDSLYRKSICARLRNIASRVYAGWVENVVDSTRFDRIDTNRFTLCRFVIPEVDLRET